MHSVVGACAAGILWTGAIARAAESLPPEKLLGPETLLVITTPDMTKAKAFYRELPLRLFLNDPAMKPFREKFGTRFREDILAPIEKELGIRFADYKGLAQGQITFAITAGEWLKEPDQEPGLLLLLDARERGADLTAAMDGLKKKWIDRGNALRKETIRDIEFSALSVEPAQLGKTLEGIFPDTKNEDDAQEGEPEKTEGEEKKEDTLEWWVGQSGSLLICGSDQKEIEQLLVRQSGGSLPALAEHASYASSHGAQLRDAVSYVWINLKTLVAGVEKEIVKDQEQPPPEEANPMSPPPGKIINALGLSGLDSLAMSVQNHSGGQLAALTLRVPGAQRKGLFKMFSYAAKESSPPPFVPADVNKFTRWRLDLPNLWSTLESSLTEVSPQMAGVLNLLIDSAGKDNDPNFDLRKNLIGNLGDDLITYQRAPSGNTLDELNTPPSIVLLGSPRAEELAAAIKSMSALMPQPGGRIKEREFLGRTLYSMPLPGAADDEGQPVSRQLHFVASGSYVALSADSTMVEEFLRSSSNEPLRDMPGLAEAAQQVGGMNNGLFGFESDRETMKAAFRILKNQSDSLNSLFEATPLANHSERSLKDWVDFALLPPFESVAKYFHFSVYGMNIDDAGFHVRAFSPRSPDLRGSSSAP